MRYFRLLLLAIYLSFCSAAPEQETTTTNIFDLGNGELERDEFEIKLAKNTENATYYEETFLSPSNRTEITVRISKEDVNLWDNITSRTVDLTLFYQNSVPLALSYDLEPRPTAELANRSWYWIPASKSSTMTIPVYFVIKQFDLSYLRVWIREAEERRESKTQTFEFNSKPETSRLYYDVLPETHKDFNITGILGFPIVVLRHQGDVQTIFKYVTLVMVVTLTFTIGCELDVKILTSYIRRPIGPAIGILCQFIIMPLIAFSMAKLAPIRREFGFGLLTMGCSPGGGTSNAYALLLGGDVNLSIMMTFVSSFASLFMLPFLIFIFGRFFIPFERVTIPYGSIVFQLLQFSIPSLIGLLLRYRFPKIACRISKFTRPFFIFFVILFSTFGAYANWSIFRLFGAYPIILPIAALLPWVGFFFAALAAFISRQPKAIIITIAIETGIQNAFIPFLVLLYSMPQPGGELGAVMPIGVAIFTPIPLWFALIVITIRRRCFQKEVPPAEVHAMDDLKTDEDEDDDNDNEDENEVVNRKSVDDDISKNVSDE